MGDILKKGYIIILSLMLVILSLSCLSAADNSTDVVKEQNDDAIALIQQEDNVSISQDDAVGAADDNASGMNGTNDEQLLGIASNTEILTVSPKEVLSTCVNVTPLASSYYKQPTKKERTFNIGKFKVTLSEAKYKKLFKATGIEDIFLDEGYCDYYDLGDKFRGYYVSGTGLRYSLFVKTNKYIKVKVKIGNKYIIKKTRASMHFTYGAGQSGIAYRYLVCLTHKYANPGYDYARVLGSDAKYFTKCKHSTDFSKLNKCSLKNQNTVYKKYSVY